MLQIYKKYGIICNSTINTNQSCHHDSKHYSINCVQSSIYCQKCRVEFCKCCHDIENYICPICLENPDSYEYKCDDCENKFYIKILDKRDVYCLCCDNIICDECYIINNDLGNRYCSNCINLLYQK
jgi:hypothetical protein